jgi:hypothetical protein
MQELFKTTKYIHFHNDTDLPVVVEGWVSTSYGLSTLKGLTVQSGEKLVVHSSVGEWHLNSMFTDSEDREMWKKKGLGDYKYLNIGKFRSNPCASGNYSWMEYDDSPFECVYSKLEEPIENVDGLVIFRQKT